VDPGQCDRAEAERALELLVTADLDGLDPAAYRPREVAKALDRGVESRNPKALARAEMMLSSSFAATCATSGRRGDCGMVYVDKGLAPQQLTIRGALEGLARHPSLQSHLNENRLDAPDLRAAARCARPSRTPRRVIERRAAGASGKGDKQAPAPAEPRAGAALPADPGPRYLLVDAAAARLWMYEDGRPVDSMKVIVGKESEQTPMMAGLIRFAMTNPFWNIPPDLVKLRVAPGYLKGGRQVPEGQGLSGHQRLVGRGQGGEPGQGRLEGGGVRRQGTAGAAAAGQGQCDGAHEVHVPQRSRHLPARHAGKEAVRERGPRFSSAACGWRMRRGWPSGCSASRSW
jgi:hypothetical protein